MPKLLFVIQVLSTFITSYLGSYAQRCRLQNVGFELPLSLIHPCSVLMVLAAYVNPDIEKQIIGGIFSDYHPFQSISSNKLDPCNLNKNSLLLKECVAILMVFIWILTQLWINRSLWSSKKQLKASFSKLFNVRGYCGLATEQSLLQKSLLATNKIVSINEDHKHNSNGGETKELSKVNIFCCATMWHETEKEMFGFLKSIFEVDENISERFVLFLKIVTT